MKEPNSTTPSEFDSPSAANWAAAISGFDPLAELSRVFPATVTEWRREREQLRRSPLEPGQLIAGRYRVQRRLGAGSMGEVYEVSDRSNNVKRALKIAFGDVYSKESGMLLFHSTRVCCYGRAGPS